MQGQTMKGNAMIKLMMNLGVLLVVAAGAAMGAEKAEGGDKGDWQVLFDGKTLKGWSNPYTWGEVKVADGEIHLVAGKKFFLLTE